MDFRNFSEIWPGGLPELLKSLQAAGFTPEKSGGEIASWATLNRPRSADLTEPQNSFFTYLSRESRGEISAGWGLVFADKKIDKKILSRISPKIPLILIERSDAAVDFVLKNITSPEWSGKTSSVPAHVIAEAGVCIGVDSQIGEGTVLEAGVRIGARVKIGKNCRIGANSRIGDDCELGDGCLLTASVSIGGPGFGFVHYPKAPARQQRLHVGRVLIGDRVRLGAFVAIDRGVFEDTRIDADVAVDNLVQIAHNCAVGQATTLCGFVGLTGSTTLGKNVTFGGLVFTKGHLAVGDNVMVAGWSGIISDVPSNQILKGYPVKPLNQALKTQVLVDKLPELYERIKKLEKALEKSGQKG